MTLHNYATPLLTILLTRLSGGVDGRNLAMNGKAARQVVARDATTLAAGSKLGDELLQKVNGDLKAWYRDKLAHGMSVVSAGGNVRAR